MTAPDISVVVCTRNRAPLLQGALASLFDLATEDEFSYEIIVIDNGSTDETPQVIADSAAKSKHPLRGILEPQPGIVPARNRGIREAQGRWIASFDDDQLADWHWLAELYRGAAEKNCRVVGGSVQLGLPADCQRQFAPAVLMLLGESMGGDEPQRYGGRLTPGCGNLMLERGVFDQVGQFETAIDGRGEDTDLFERIRLARIDAWYVPTAIIHHLTPPDRLEREYLLSLAERMGRGMALRHRRSLGLARFSFLWLTKLARIAVLEYPLLIWAGIRRDEEHTLGRRCLLTISQGYLNGLCPPSQAAANQAKASTAGAPDESLPKNPANPTAAMLFTLRNGEPTAVMEFPGFSLAAPAPTAPIQR